MPFSLRLQCEHGAGNGSIHDAPVSEDGRYTGR
jgi:hypothetical protein